MEHDRSGKASRKDILRGVYEDNKRIKDRSQPYSSYSARTYASGFGGAIVLIIILIAATNYAFRDANRDGFSAPGSLETTGSGALGEQGPEQQIPIQGNALDSEEIRAGRSDADAANALDALASSPVPLAELFHLGVQTIVIDAGHGGRDPGALGSAGLMEKDITLDVAQRLARRLRDRQGLRVAMTRDSDEARSLKERADFSNREEADLFVSIHVNQFPEEPVYALETYYFGRQTSASVLRLAALENENSDYGVAEFNRMVERIGNRVKLEESRRLAEHVQRSMFRNTRALNARVKNWGVKTAPFVVLVGAEAPGILAEIGVISNSEEETRLATPEYREKLALFLEEGIVLYLNELSDQEALKNGATENATEEEVDD